MYSSVPTTAPNSVNSVCSVSRWPVALATPKSITLGTGWPSYSATRTLDGLRSRWMIPFWWACCTAWQTGTNSSSRSRGVRLVLVAVAGDRDALDQLHDEVGPARVGRAGVEDLGDVGVVHQGQGLPLGLEAGEDLAAVHAGLDDLQGDHALHRLGLLGHVDGAHAAFADLLQQLVGADRPCRAAPASRVRRGPPVAAGRRRVDRSPERSGGLFEEAGVIGVGSQQGLHVGPQTSVAGAGLVEVSVAARPACAQLQGVDEDLALVHGSAPSPGFHAPCRGQNPRRIFQDLSISALSARPGRRPSRRSAVDCEMPSICGHFRRVKPAK